MTKLFRLRTKDGYVSPVTSVTNVHGVDMANVIIPAAVAAAIIAKKVDWRDCVQCVVSGKDPTVLLKKPDALKPRQELADAPDFDQQAAVTEVAPPIPDAPKESELSLARTEGRAPDLAKLTEEEIGVQAALVGVDPKSYSSQKGLVKAIQRKMETAGT